ncbi:hypothetical protein ACFL2Z_01445, partial [Candidatus Eisenbacteria bacterium]
GNLYEGGKHKIQITRKKLLAFLGLSHMQRGPSLSPPESCDDYSDTSVCNPAYCRYSEYRKKIDLLD